jgi:ubiquitin carboxyl-terminal hydrolase 9/24
MFQDAVTLHRKFIDECYKWLEAAVIPLEGSMVAQTLLQATKVLSVVSMPQGSSFPTPSRYLRFLFICKAYNV